MHLTPDQELIVQEELLEFFVFCQDEVAADLGVQRQPDTHNWSDEDADRIIAEIDRRYRSVIADRFKEGDDA